MKNRLNEIRESEKKSHTKIYSNEKLYNTNSWLSKPIKTVCEVAGLFADYKQIRVLDLGAGVGRNSIYLAQQFKEKECLIDCVDLLDIAIEILDQNAAEYDVCKFINGMVATIEDFSIEQDSYDLIMAISALEHVDSKKSFISKLEQIKQGVRSGGVVLLIMNSQVKEINANTLEELEPQFEVNLSTTEMLELLDDIFFEFTVIKKNIVTQEYDIPREDIISRLYTNVVTYVARR